MLSQVISASLLYQIVASPTSDNEAKLRSINELKTHVKKDFVDIKQVPKYVEALSIAVDISDAGILTNSFSVLSHLVKRVSMQDSSGEVLKSQSYLILPILINRLGDSKASARSSAKKALEAYWFSAPKEVEESIMNMALSHKNVKVINESIVWLDHIITNVNPHFKINLFLPHIVKLLRLYSESDEVLIENIRTLFKDYYSLKHNRLYKFDLSKEFEIQKIPSSLHESIISQIRTNSSHLVKHTTPDIGLDQNFILAGTIRVTVSDKSTNLSKSLIPTSFPTSTMSRPKSRTNFHNYTKSILPSQEDEHMTKSSTQNSAFTKYNSNQMLAPPPKPVNKINDHSNEIKAEISPEIEKIIAKTFTYKIDSSIPPLDFKGVDEFNGTVNDLLTVFEGKETEFNWGMRERNIVKLRSIIRGNSSTVFINELITYLKEYSESICKAVTSLRTTLSSHGCHLLKESAVILKENFEPLVDSYIPHLMKLCSATKHIASSNANMTLCAIFINVPYNYRLLQKILVSANEKNVQPRSYSGIWLQIVLVRFNDSTSFSSHGPNSLSGVDTSIKILTKLLADPNPNVRQVAKDAYWCFWEKFPSEAESLLTRLDSNVVKAIERSKPRTVTSRNQPSTLSSLTAKKARPSIKESIIARNKELRNKQKDQKIISRPSSRVNSTSSTYPPDNEHSQMHEKLQFSTQDSGKFSRLGIAKRTSSTSSLSRIESNQDVFSRKVSESVNSTNQKFNDAQIKATDDQVQNDQTIGSSSLTDKNASTRTSIPQTKSFDSFDKQSDPILKFLSSHQKDFIAEGINLLKYAIMGEEDLSSEVNGLLRKISVRNQDLLKPLFLGTDNLLKKTFQFFQYEDFFRVCCILIHPIDKRLVDMVVTIAAVDDIYESAVKLISYSTNLGNIIDDSDLTMQIIRFKSIIVRLIIEFLNQGLDRIPISDSHFLKLVTNLFELVSLVKSTGLYKSFCELLTKLYSINPTLFISELQMIASSTREEVEYVVGIDDILDLNQGHSNNFTTLYELTRVVPGNNIGEISPLKAPSDLTMVLPTVTADKECKSNNVPLDSGKRDDNFNEIGFQTSPKLGSKEASPVNSESYSIIETDKKITETGEEAVNDDMDVDQNPYEETESNYEMELQNDNCKPKEKTPNSILDSLPIDESDNIFVEVDSDLVSRKPDLFTKFTQQDNSSELAENFAQVQITELCKHKIRNPDPIKTFIDKVDPLNKVSLKNKPISIYEDGRFKGSPQKVKDYSYTELNWFNFQLAKLAMDNADNQEADYCVEEFKSLCDNLSSKNIEGKEFVTLLNYLQNTKTFNAEFSSYFQSLGQALIEGSLWNFFDNHSILSVAKKLSGLILLKQLLINRLRVDLERLWNLLVGLSSESRNSTDEISLAIGEAFDEMLAGLFSSEVIFARILTTLESAILERVSFSLSFILECLSKVLNTNAVSLLIDKNLILRIDNALSDFMNDEEVEIRRSVILSYGRLLKASRISSTVKIDENDKSEYSVMEDIMKRLSIPQKKLIEYYSHS